MFRKMKKLAIMTFVLAAIFGLSACASDDSEVVVEMDQGDITKDELYEELLAAHGEAVLHNLVYAAILEDKFEVSEKIIDEEIDLVKNQYGESFEMVLMQHGYASEEAYRESLETHLLEQEAITEDIEVSDEEIEARYNRYITEVEASHILVEDEEFANELYQELLDGADFAELAGEHSTDPGSGDKGGELGYFKAKDMVPEFEDAAYQLGVDEISEPVQSTHGWHIIKVTDIRDYDGDVDSLEDMRPMLRTEIALPQADNEYIVETIQSLFEASNISVNIDQFEDLFTFEDIPQADPTDVE